MALKAKTCRENANNKHMFCTTCIDLQFVNYILIETKLRQHHIFVLLFQSQY